jgi:hypothetical protein
VLQQAAVALRAIVEPLTQQQQVLEVQHAGSSDDSVYDGGAWPNDVASNVAAASLYSAELLTDAVQQVQVSAQQQQQQQQQVAVVQHAEPTTVKPDSDTTASLHDDEALLLLEEPQLCNTSEAQPQHELQRLPHDEHPPLGDAPSTHQRSKQPAAALLYKAVCSSVNKTHAQLTWSLAWQTAQRYRSSVC